MRVCWIVALAMLKKQKSWWCFLRPTSNIVLIQKSCEVNRCKCIKLITFAIMSMVLSKISDSIASHKLFEAHDVVIVALSGGADSVALLCALVKLGYHCVAAHCNFHLRGEESMRDCLHAQSIAAALGVECHTTDFDVKGYMQEHGVSIEMACRELRYEWFEQLRVEVGAAAIAVAHHRDDNIETFFLNLLRGTGIAGLSGMAPRNGYIVRPMLNCTREEIEGFLTEQNLTFVTDSTNLENDFSRNRLRNIVLPSLYDQFPNAADAIEATISMLQDNEAIYRQKIGEARESYVTSNDEVVTIALDRLIANEQRAATILFELLRPFKFNATQARDMISASETSGKSFIAPRHIAIINRHSLIIRRNDNEESQSEYTIDLSGDIFSPIRLTIKPMIKPDGDTSTSTDTILLDASVLADNPTFTLRKWRKGDRFAPFGMRGTKKLSDVFSDAKLSLFEKSQMWLLTRNDVILWIVGLRASRHFPVTDSTTSVLKITYIP